MKWSPGCDCCGNCVAVEYGVCECIDGDYGTRSTIDRVDIVLSGSQSFSKAHGCSGTGTGATWTGTYSISCQSNGNYASNSEVWTAETFCCTSGGFDYYLAERLLGTLDIYSPEFGYANGRYVVTLIFETVETFYGAGNPPQCSSISNTCFTNPSRINYAGPDPSLTKVYEFTPADATDYEFTNPGSCPGTVTRLECQGAISLDSTTAGATGPSSNCWGNWNINGVTISSVEIIWT